jgi:uncharacterized repeat protein (TIGR01451 family)
MKKAYLFSFMIIINFVLNVSAQSITTSQMFNGTTKKHLSFGGDKFGWVEQTGNIFTHYYMDTLLNYTAYANSNLIASPSQTVYDTVGNILCASTMGPNGQLIGLLFNAELFSDSNFISFPQYGGGCYFLYDFSTQQSQYFYFNNGTFMSPDENTSYEFDWNGNNLHLIMVKTNFTGFSNWAHAFEFSGINLNINYPLIFPGGLNAAFFDDEGAYNYIGDDFTIGNWYKNTTGNVQIDMSFGANAMYHDAASTDTATYILYSNTSGFGSPFADTVLISNATFQTKIALPNVSYSIAALCVDHANRIWIVESDSVIMYNGTNWNSFSLNGLNTLTGNLSAYVQRSFFEYRKNCFAITYYHSLNSSIINNGIIFFSYSDSGTINVLNHIQGTVFYDINSNSTQDLGEPIIPNQIVTTGTYTTNSYVNGLYNMLLPYGTHNIVTSTTLPYITIAPVSHNLNFAAPNLVDTNNLNFAFQPSGPIADVKVNLSSTPHRNGQVITYVLSYTNTGTSPVSGSVALQYETILNFDSTNVTPTNNTPGSLTWNYSNLLPFESRNIYCYFYNTNLTLNDTIWSNAAILPVAGDNVPSDNVDSLNRRVLGPFDPNMKEVFQNGYAVNTIYDNDYLSYTIHFQNVGNDTAFTVLVIDTLDNHLDISTLQITGSTHAYTLSVNNRILQFTFNNINLPDSNTNVNASMGLITFKIKPLNTLSNGTQINNYAAIYFDLNAPIITNNAQVTMATPTLISNKSKSPEIKLYPNPTNGFLTLENLTLNSSIIIKNILGQTIFNTQVSNQKINLDLRLYNNGVYLIEVVQEKTVITHKIVLQK